MENRDGYERYMEIQSADAEAEAAYAAGESARAQAEPAAGSPGGSRLSGER